jgi:hypothetical protein
VTGFVNDRLPRLLLGGYDCNVVLASIPPYIQLMSTVRMIGVLVVASLAAGQQIDSATSSNIPAPKLPVIDYAACPGKSNAVLNVKLIKDDVIYSSPDRGKLVARLGAGEKVTVLAGANVVRQPDIAVIKYVSKNDAGAPPLKVGDVVLGYGWHVDGNMVFWAKGAWFQANLEGVAEKGACGFTSGFGPGGCTIDIVNDGTIEWWVQVKSKDVSGWVLAVRYNDDNRWYRWHGNFYDLLQGHCSLD